MIRIKTLRQTINNKHIQKTQLGTLLQKAQEYRRNNDDLLKVDDERSFEKPNEDEFDADLFLQDYYDTMKEIREQEREFEQSRPSSFHIQLMFTQPKKRSAYEEQLKKKENKKEHLSSFKSIIAKENHYPSCCSNKEKLDTRMMITIYDAVQLNRMLASDIPKLKNCKVKCTVKIGKGKKAFVKVVNTDYGYCNEDGSTAWYHEVVIKGFSLKELKEAFVMLELIGLNKYGKVPIAKVILSGKPDQLSKPSESTNSLKLRKEYKEWVHALHDPGTVFSIVTHIKPSYCEEFGKSLLSMLVKEANLFKSDDLDLIGLKKMKKQACCSKTA